jgi:hypothetical protein
MYLSGLGSGTEDAETTAASVERAMRRDLQVSLCGLY